MKWFPRHRKHQTQAGTHQTTALSLRPRNLGNWSNFLLVNSNMKFSVEWSHFFELELISDILKIMPACSYFRLCAQSNFFESSAVKMISIYQVPFKWHSLGRERTPPQVPCERVTVTAPVYTTSPENSPNCSWVRSVLKHGSEIIWQKSSKNIFSEVLCMSVW